jgi:hypothetical protein
MIYMKKISVVFCILFLSVFIAGTVLAENENAYFLLDTDLATAGHQGIGEVLEIGSRVQVGFSMHAMNWTNASGLTVKFEWDGTKAEYRGTKSALSMVDDDLDVNGAEIVLAEEDNILPGSPIEAGVVDSEGFFTASYASTSGASTAAEGLIFMAIFRTVDGFSATDAVTIKASCTVADENGNARFLGTRYFHVNTPVSVEDATWGEVKKQYKDF